MTITNRAGESFEILWAGVATIDGALRFEIINKTASEVFESFSDPEKTQLLIQDWDGLEERYRGFTKFKTIDMQPNGNIIVALSR